MADVVQLSKYIDQAENLYNRIVLVVGPPGSGKSRLLRQLDDTHIINLSKELSKELMLVPKGERTFHVQDMLREIVSSAPTPVIVFDNIELLFSPDLQIDPLRAFENLSRNKTLVVAWTGSFNGKQLTWAEPGHPEYRVYDDRSCPDSIVKLID